MGKEYNLNLRGENDMSEKTMVSAATLKLEFLRLLTEDSPHQDMRRRDFNQGIFDAENGWAVFNGTDLEMVMEKFNKAVANLMRDHVREVLTANESNRNFYRNGYGPKPKALPGKEE